MKTPIIYPSTGGDIATLLGCNLPDLRHNDMHKYLMNLKSKYNHKTLCACKSLEPYKYFVAGWISEQLITDINQGNASTVCIITASVRYFTCSVVWLFYLVFMSVILKLFQNVTPTKLYASVVTSGSYDKSPCFDYNLNSSDNCQYTYLCSLLNLHSIGR